MVDAATGGALMNKTHEAAYELLEELASNNYQWPTERAMPRKTAGVLELDSITSLAAQMATLSQQLGNHSSVDCQVRNPFAQSSYGQANYVSNLQRQNNPYSNTYNLGWGNHPNFSWSNNQGQAKPPQQFPQQEKKLTLEDMFMQYMQKTDIGQLSSMLTERTAGTLPSNTVTNPKEHVKAISLRSGRTYEEPKVTNAKQDEAVDNEDSKMKEAESEMKEVEQAEKTKENERASKFEKSREDIISKKRKLEEHETVILTEESSAILQKKMKLGLGEVKPTTISLQLANRSIKYPRGVIEDVLVKVDKFIFLADFIVLDMDEDEEIPLILGRPFLATGRTLINVQQGKLVLRVGEDDVTFDGFKPMKFPFETHSCFQISDRDMIMADETCAIDFLKLPLEVCLTHSTPVIFNDEEVKECERYLEATPLFPPSMQPKVEDLKSCQPTSPPEEPPKLSSNCFHQI
nr:uncharacterized protein LOC111985214 [Quercus suber]